MALGVHHTADRCMLHNGTGSCRRFQQRWRRSRWRARTPAGSPWRRYRGRLGGATEIARAVMDAAFRLAEAAPAARATILPRGDAIGAGHATDGQEALGLERMRRQAALGEFAFDALAREAGKRVDADALVDQLDRRQRVAHAALIALASGNDRDKAGQRPFQRLDLAQPAASIGVFAPQRAAGVAALERARIGGDCAQVAEAEPFGKRVAIAQRLAEE